MKKIVLLTLLAVLTLTPALISAQNDNNGRFSVINEYGPFFGQNTIGFTGTFVAGYTLPNQQEMFGLGVGYEAGVDINQGIPMFLNFRHIFKPNKTFSPIVNVAIGTRYCIPNYYNNSDWGYYMTVGSGFQANLFSLSGGLFFKSYGTSDFFIGLELKVGYKL
jgi:hypothetical protein